MPPGRLEYERECFIVVKQLAILRHLVQTRESEAEGGARSCFLPLAEWASSSSPIVALLLRYIHKCANMLAHQGVVDLTLFMTAVLLVVEHLGRLEEFPVVKESRQSSGTRALSFRFIVFRFCLV